ncbi:hypothetical protein [Prosthecobacter fluviatilis]|uniref:Uncharacterized protein n=1 Tax=Prosthecobacter fluviatilis TaxID=445931 RepID=A0ABW0KJG8_9BACT
MKVALIILIVLVFTMNSWAADRSKDLASELSAAWESVTVSMMIDQGCVAPEWRGVRVRSDKGVLTVSTWKDAGKGGANDKTEGPVRPVASFTREKLCAAILRHYQTAVASEDTQEYLASLSTQEEREKEMSRIFKTTGHPIGGFGAIGIDIRIVRDGRVIHFSDSYGEIGADAFGRWLEEIISQAK